jgi:hypothetical protein
MPAASADARLRVVRPMWPAAGDKARGGGADPRTEEQT